MVRRAESWRDLSGDSGFKLGDGSLLPHSERVKAGDDLLLSHRDQLQLADGLLLTTNQETHLLRLHSQILGRVQVHLQVFPEILASA
jgi:hypothetical protein